jgi:succinate dehydrogenase / fumarate reductase cytochrome b subunit
MASPSSPAAPRKPRPLSPHLQIYKPQITSVLSISHRITGVALSAGTLVLVAWIAAAAFGDAATYARIAGIIGSWFGQILLFGWTVALYYHLLNGIRHLFWDAGHGFALPTMEKSGYAVLAGTAILTVLTWLVAKAA